MRHTLVGVVAAAVLVVAATGPAQQPPPAQPKTPPPDAPGSKAAAPPAAAAPGNPLDVAVTANNGLATVVLPIGDPARPGQLRSGVASPFGVLSVLSVLRPGAAGETAAEMDKVLKLSKQGADDLLVGVAGLTDVLNAAPSPAFGLTVEPAAPAGVKVKDVAAGSRAAQAGFKANDVILTVGGRPADPAGVEQALGSPAGAVVEVQGADGMKSRVVLAATADANRHHLRAANGIWGQSNLKFEPLYTGLLSRTLPPGLQSVDFTAGGGEPARQAINQWTARQTDGKITELFKSGQVNAQTKLAVVSTLTFEGLWKMPFDKKATNEQHAFQTVPPRTPPATVPMMSQRKTLPYRKGAGYQLVELPFKGDRVGMVVVVPEKADGLLEVIQEVWKDPAGPSAGPAVFMNLGLPRFSVRNRIDLPETLAAAGMPSPFDPKKANFSGITQDQGLFVSTLVQEAFIEVDEAGARAGAATGGGLVPKSQPEVSVLADRPFYFAIRDRATGAILFHGVYTGPDQPAAAAPPPPPNPPKS